MMKNYSRQWNRIPRRFGVIREECLNAESLEYLLLTAHKNRALYNLFEEHFLTCEKCMRKIKKMEKFYRLLEQELVKPVSSQSVEFARGLVEAN